MERDVGNYLSFTCMVTYVIYLFIAMLDGLIKVSIDLNTIYNNYESIK